MRRLAGIVTTGVLAVTAAVALAGGGSAEIGAKLPFDGQDDYAYLACNQDPHCLYVQRSIGGTRVTRAPFDGRVKKWTLVEPIGTFRLAVVRKVGTDTYKLVRWSQFRTVAETDPHEEFTFNTNLKIRKRDFVGIVSEDFPPAAFAMRTSVSADNCRIGFVQGIYPGDSGTPGISYNVCGQKLLYNAKIVR